MEKRPNYRTRRKARIAGCMELHQTGELEKPITFTVVAERLRAKPRMTKGDRWRKRPIIERWFAFKDLVALSYRHSGGHTFFNPVTVDYEFFLSNFRRIDADNLIKGINDALVGLAFPDDCVKYIKGGTFHITFLPKDSMEKAVITIKPEC